MAVMRRSLPKRACVGCGRVVATDPRAVGRASGGSGKRRVRHKCPHGRWCIFGSRIGGIGVKSLCPECRASTLTSEAINALSPAVRNYVHQLESRADPAGDVAARIAAQENCEALQVLVAEMQHREHRTIQALRCLMRGEL